MVYSISYPLRFAGEYKKDLPLLRLIPDSIGLHGGCNVLLYRVDERYFVGSIVDNDCKSNLRSASYATSELILNEDGIII